MGNKRTPEIRFSGFTGEWEQRKIGNHAEILTGGTPKTQIKEYWEPSEIPWMSSGEVNKKRLSSTDNMISFLGFENSSARWVKENSILIALAGQGKTRGTVAINEIPLTTNQSIAAIVPKEELHYEFVFQSLEKRYEELRLISSGDGTRGGLNKQLVADVVIISPSIEEQIKIGNFFKQLDDTIALHQQELTTLKQTKQGFLQKMFPKEGESVPEVRFPGFTGDWEERKLGEMSYGIEYGLNASAIEYDGENKYIRITDIDDTTHKFLEDSLTSPNIDLASAENYLLKVGDILFARTGASVGKTYIYDNKDGKVYYAGFLIRARIKSGYDPGFVFQNTLTTKYNEFIKITSQRSGQPGVNAQEYANFSIMVPSIDEQQTIGTFFKQLDDTIALHQRELDALKETKKAFLQKMFV
ncbi:restriction endonuclease subunit S [Bacillus haynesii]|uniref:restriction endonuclease subunit S n=1 Tax=Bacillus haynesii TaxID=1925021 RepID=UPI002280434F|nr:restriction endonuclease subunit S [Bacillus haynesii]MCY8344645.1 restriction endonuclease subunit S [Bacillus haynesii]MCY8349353.1 restriction endonuclease subunit S [Bacillus haynesii]MCY8436781.1 restriction endonuclease subunit S [Bacillus haynesii]MCY8558082.1 restriction endonuclease subunit S [Bacillus haynesii]MCY9156783.1 restriction endonuclease subunit S [Bacillus haynesii]